MGLQHVILQTTGRRLLSPLLIPQARLLITSYQEFVFLSEKERVFPGKAVTRHGGEGCARGTLSFFSYLF